MTAKKAPVRRVVLGVVAALVSLYVLEEDVACSHSVFPQGGDAPCWYVVRHADDPIPI